MSNNTLCDITSQFSMYVEESRVKPSFVLRISKWSSVKEILDSLIRKSSVSLKLQLSVFNGVISSRWTLEDVSRNSRCSIVFKDVNICYNKNHRRWKKHRITIHRGIVSNILGNSIKAMSIMWIKLNFLNSTGVQIKPVFVSSFYSPPLI